MHSPSRRICNLPVINIRIFNPTKERKNNEQYKRINRYAMKVLIDNGHGAETPVPANVTIRRS